MMRIQRSEDKELLTFGLSGRIEQQNLAELQQLLDAESNSENITLDLEEVKLVDRPGVLFLAGCEARGIQLKNCPSYIRQWIRGMLPEMNHNLEQCADEPAIGTSARAMVAKATSLRRLDADLRHLNRVSMLGELAASVADEVNQPLSGVVINGSACLRFLAGDAPNVEEAREAVRDIVRDARRAGEIIARIWALATKRAAMQKEELDLNKTIQEVLALVGDEAKKKVIIRTEFAEDLSPVLGDRVQLRQVALNLVMNAIEAMRSVDDRTRELVVTTRNMDADQVLVTIEDSGIGVDRQMTDKIFDSFYTTKPGGMGMGLSISRSIVHAHGGRLFAIAKDGPGAIFHITLPKHHEPGSNAAAARV